MATLSRAESKDMYSWWWDSHISPKNSKWLQGNLTDMDSKVKTMIKLIEVDEDSFARRAEMYYKKRPELMKLVEEFYRAYRALAERYDHATGVLRQAHTTMAEAFPNQAPFFTPDDAPVNPAHDTDPHTPEKQTDLQRGTNGNFTNESESIASKKGSKQLNGFGKARKGLNFHGAKDREDIMLNNERHQEKTQVLSESERLGRSEYDIQALKDALAKLESEKEAGLLEYQKTRERLSKLESDFSLAKEDSQGLNERASKAEAEVQNLNKALAYVEAEREASLVKYQQCLERVSNLEVLVSRAEKDAGQLNDRTCKAEKEAAVLRDELFRLKVETEALLAKYMEALEKLANLENKLLLAEDYSSSVSERAERAEREVDTLSDTITRLTEEKEAANAKYEQSLEKITSLEREILLIQGEAERLKAEVHDNAAKLKKSEELHLLLDRSNKSLQSEVNSLEQKVVTQNEELSEKQKELGRLWTCVQEERMRFIEAEASFQSLQNSHSKVREELRAVANELQKKIQLLKELEIRKQQLEDEVHMAKHENESVIGVNLSQATSLQNMQVEILDLKDGKENLELELQLRLDQRSALQQEIYSLKEELNGLSLRHRDMLRQVEFVGFDPASFGSSVEELQNENSKLKESCLRSTNDIASLVSKLGMMEKLAEKNKLLENSLSNLNTELEGARLNVKELEESCLLLMGEKSTLAAENGALVSQLQLTTENLEKLAQRNTLVENSLFDVNAELEMLRLKSEDLEHSCKLLNDQNSVLFTEKQIMVSELGLTHSKLEDLCKTHADLEKRYTCLEEERKSTLHRVEELQVFLEAEKVEHANSNQLSQTQIADLENQIYLLQQAGNHMREELEEELDEAVNAQFEIFILRKCIQDLKENNFSLLKYCKKLLDALMMSESLISELEQESLDQQDEFKVMSSQIRGLRMGLGHLLDSLEADGDLAEEIHDNEDQRLMFLIQEKLISIKASTCDAWDENQELIVQKSVLLAVIQQLKLDVADLNAFTFTFKQEIGIRSREILRLQGGMQNLLESNEELILKVREGNIREAVLLTEVESLREKLLNLQGAYEDLQKANRKVVEENKSLTNSFEDLEVENCHLEDDCRCMVGDVVALDNLSFVLKNVIIEKSNRVTELTETIENIYFENNVFEEKVRSLERNLEDARTKNVNFELSLKKSENELEEVRVVNDQLTGEIANGMNLLCLKEMELSRAESVKDSQEFQILELSENYAQQLKEYEELRQLIGNLHHQISKMHKDHDLSVAKVRVLSAELQTGREEVKLWETVAATFFTELQSSSVREALIKEKFAELNKAYETLEDESYSKCMDIAHLKERVGVLEGENSDIKARLAADLSAIMSLKDSVTSLEKHANSFKKIRHTNNDEKEDVGGSQISSEPLSGGFVNLHEVQARIRDVEKAVIELKQHAEEESNVRSDLDSALKQIEALKFLASPRRGSGRFGRRVASKSAEDLNDASTDGRKQKPSPDGSELGEELLMKDIVLDQASDCSSYGRNRKVIGSDDQILELWETIDHSGSIDLTVGKPTYRANPNVPNKYSHLEAVKENKSGRPSVESLVERELGVDEQLSSKRFPKPLQDDNKRKTLERLASDVQKLTNLQITVQDLKLKLETTESTSSKGKAIECDGVKEQLIESEQTILKLFDYSAKVMKNIENSSSASSSMSFDGSSASDPLDAASAKRKKSMEHARRISEKIGRLQLEVQKVQFLLMKLDNNKIGKSGGGTRIFGGNTRVILKDYLYGVPRTPHRRKKTRFCGCVQPATKNSD